MSEEAVRREKLSDGRDPDATVDEVGVPGDDVGFDGSPLRSRGGTGYGTGVPTAQAGQVGVEAGWERRRPVHADNGDVRPRVPTAPIAATGLIAGYGVAVASGSRPLGGVVLAACGVACLATWLQRDGRRTATMLTLAGLAAFALSHALGPVIGDWPAVLISAAATSGLAWRLSDARHLSVQRLAERPVDG